MEKWLTSGNLVVCPHCEAEWSKVDNQTYRFSRCPNCGKRLVQPKKHRQLSFLLTTTNGCCSPKKFRINGVKATTYDFGQSLDEDPANADQYGCGRHVFRHFERPRSGVLDKYDISMDDYRAICAELDVRLSRGKCRYCA